MYFITTKRMLEVCFSVHPNIQYRTKNINFIVVICFLGIIICYWKGSSHTTNQNDYNGRTSN